MTPATQRAEFARRARTLVGELIGADPLAARVIDSFAEVFEQVEQAVLEVVRSRYIDLADPDVVEPDDLVRLGAVVGLGAEPGMPTEVFRERLRLFVRAYLQGAGTPQSILTMAAAELGVLVAGDAHREGTVWLQPVRRVGDPADVIRLEENPVYRVERQPVLAKTGTRWSIDNPGISGDMLVRPQVSIEALVNDVRGPSIILEDVGLAWLSPTVVLHRGDRLTLRVREDGRFSATKHSHAGAVDVTDEIELIGRVPGVEELAAGIGLGEGDELSAATALVKDDDAPRVVRFCARSVGRWGNGLSVRSTRAGDTRRLEVGFDPVMAITGEPGDSLQSTAWSVDVGADETLLEAALNRFEPGRFVLEAQDATLFLPLGRSRWLYFDHLAVLTEDGDLRNLARLLLDYTRFGEAVHHETDSFEVFRFDRDETRFEDALYTTEEERVQITFSWLEPRPTAIRIEVPPWIAQEEDPAVRARLYRRLADGIRRIKPAGVAASVMRDLPSETVHVSEVFPDHITVAGQDGIAIDEQPAADVQRQDGASAGDGLALETAAVHVVEAREVMVPAVANSLHTAMVDAIELTSLTTVEVERAQAVGVSAASDVAPAAADGMVVAEQTLVRPGLNTIAEITARPDPGPLMSDALSVEEETRPAAELAAATTVGDEPTLATERAVQASVTVEARRHVDSAQREQVAAGAELRPEGTHTTAAAVTDERSMHATSAHTEAAQVRTEAQVGGDALEPVAVTEDAAASAEATEAAIAFDRLEDDHDEPPPEPS
ncbi:hypothetical protein [Haliangium sp.]|uniref:hypothetical protein n=1 Tax=Haliangium sp. TaxID=2663208 RepID=UPI003D11F7C9